ncbi:MAG: OsmC family protein [Candidatus Schekmanbacteria bacterium]|nr:OsmC family protein [Candidatus Schekmanbacteria bacterium]
MTGLFEKKGEKIPSMEMKIAYKGSKKFLATCRGHQMIIDLPEDQEGSDAGMTPPETFVASLGSCMGVYILNYCRNVKINPTDMLISVDWEKGANPARISHIKVNVKIPRMTQEDRKEALIKVAEHCLVHNTIHNPPKVEIELLTGEEEA